MRSSPLTLGVCCLTLSAMAPLPPARFLYTAGDVVTVSGTAEAIATVYPPSRSVPSAAHQHNTVSLDGTFTLGETGLVESDLATVQAYAYTHIVNDCVYFTQARARTEVLWQLSARPTQITFDASSTDANADTVEGPDAQQPPGGVIQEQLTYARSEEQVLGDPLVVDVPFHLVQPGMVVLRSLTANRVRSGCAPTVSVPDPGNGGTIFYCLIHDDADQDGVPDGPAFFAEYVAVGNDESASAPLASAALTAGHYVMAFQYERITSEEAGTDGCSWSTQCIGSVVDHVRAVLDVN